MRLADRTTRIASSPTMKVTATVDRLRRSGIEVIDFGAGEPDFPTPTPVKAAAHDALDRDFTKYTPAAGIAELKRAVADDSATASTRGTARRRGDVLGRGAAPSHEARKSQPGARS